jgi:hypothetical protein
MGATSNLLGQSLPNRLHAEQKGGVMIRKSCLILSLATGLCLGSVSVDVAFGQAPISPKLNIGNIIFNPTQDGFYNANVNIYVQPPDNPQINFSVVIQHVRSLHEVYDELKPAVDRLADELKQAKFDRPNILAQPNVLQNPNLLK